MVYNLQCCLRLRHAQIFILLNNSLVSNKLANLVFNQRVTVHLLAILHVADRNVLGTVLKGRIEAVIDRVDLLDCRLPRGEGPAAEGALSLRAEPIVAVSRRGQVLRVRILLLTIVCLDHVDLVE